MATGFNQITKQFLESMMHFSNILAGGALHLAYILATLTLVISVLVMLMQGEDLNKMFSKLLQTVFLFGFFFGLIANSGTWIPAIFNSFMSLGGKSAGLDSLSPNSVFEVGLNIAGKMFAMVSDLGIMHLPTALIAVICGFFVFIIYCFIAAEVVVNLVKSYALIAVAPIVFALGNSDFTRSTVMNYVKKVIGLGIHLMMLYVIVGVGVQLGDKWVTAFQNAQGASELILSAILPMLGGLVLLYLIMKNLPAFIAEISGAGGFRNYGDAAIAAAVAGASSLTNTLSKGARGVGLGVQGIAGAAHSSGSFADKMPSFGTKPSSALGDNADAEKWSKTNALFKGINALAKTGGAVAGGSVGFASGVGGKSIINRVKPHFTGNQ
jgi:type IV secretion system protein TrbL